MARRTFGCVVKRGQTYYIRYVMGGRVVKKAIGPRRRDAADALADIASKIAREEHLGIRDVAPASLAEVWGKVAPVFRARLTPHGFRCADLGVGVAGAHFGDRALSDLRAADVGDFLAALSKPRAEGGRGAKPATVNRYASLLSRVFAEAEARGLSRGNPVRGIHRPREEGRPVPFLAVGDLRRIEARTPADFRAFVALAGETGMRRGEIVALDWADVHAARRRIVVRRSKSKRPREVPLTVHALGVLDALRADRGPLPLTGEDPVFPGLDAKRLSRAFPAWAKAAGFPRLRLHDLRHGWASRLARAGVPVTDIQRLGGWGSLRMVERYGSHAPRDFGDRALDALERAEGEREDGSATVPRKGTPGATPGGPPVRTESA